MGFLINLLYILFFLAGILLIAVVLLQESKGGGLAEAFGGTGAETFGVKATGISRFTFLVAAIFIASAVAIHALRHTGTTQPIQPPVQDLPGPGR